MKSKSPKIINYSFPTFKSIVTTKLPNSFFLFKAFIPRENSNVKNSKLQCDAMLDCGSLCNFISPNLVKKLKLKTHKALNEIIIKGISGTTNSINEFVNLKFQLKIFLKNKFYFITFKEKFLITNNIPLDLLFGNVFMKKYKIHYNYRHNILYSNQGYTKFNNKNLKIYNYNKYPNDDDVIETIIDEIKSHSDARPSKSELPYVNSYVNFLKMQRKIKGNSNKYSNFTSQNLPIWRKFYYKDGNQIHPFNYNMWIHSFLSQKEDDANEESNGDKSNEEPRLEDIPEPYRDLYIVFSKSQADKLPPHRLTDCKIVLQEDASLHYGPIYPLSVEESKVLKEYIKENLAKGFIRPSESPAGYPVLFQKKKDGSLRLCVDYKKLNAVTIRNSYPIPLINDIIEKVKGAKYFTKLDLRSAYNLIRIRSGDEYKTAFRTKYGHFEYLVMPFGLRNAPATFQSFINSVLRPYLEKFVILYLDDILIFSKNLEEHHDHVRQVLKKLIENNLYAKLTKCEFDKSEVEFLGYVISGTGVSTDPKKIKSIKEWPVPQCVKDVQRFVGLCNYYRRFVENFADIAKPLHQLTRKNVQFKWTNECNKSFLELKKRLTTSPVLIHPDPQKQYIVECDASNLAIGAILSQRDDNNRLHPVAYYSRSLSNAEINYSITDKELLSIKEAFSTWRHLLLGAKHKIKVYTDHRNLLYTLGGKIGNQRQHRWHLFFQEYDFELIYRQGKKNGKPDSLSRRPDYMNKDVTEKPEYILDIKNVKEIPCFMGIANNLIERIIEYTKDDETAKDIHLYFQPNNANQGYFYRPFRKMKKFRIENNLILYNNLIYIPEKLRLEILMKYHEKPSAGHLGIKRTLELITRNFWWPKVHKDVARFVRSCETCMRNKINRHRKYGLLQPLETPSRPWDSIEIDFLCGLPSSKGYTVIMVVVDRFSKMIHLIPFKQIPDAKQTAEAFMNNIYKLHGLPKDIITDRGSQFTSALWQELMELLGVKSIIATTDHHETVGQVERCNSFIEQYLRCYSKAYYHDDWIDWLYLAEFSYNNAVNESTKQTPFFINYGYHPRMDDNFMITDIETNLKIAKNISDNFNHIKDVLIRSKELYKRAADKRRMIAPNFKEGDLVWIQSPPSFNTEEKSKLAPCKYGPYKVQEVLKNNNYKINIRNSPFPKHHPIFHISELEPFIPTPPEFVNRTADKESIKDIIEISGFRTNYKLKRYEYRVRYKYRTQSNWVPSSEVEDNPRNQKIYLLYLKNGRTFTSMAYN